jgi:hypothetical protein
MILDRSTLIRTSAAVFLGASAVSTAGAQERALFTWNSTVDREVLVVVRGRDVQVRGSGLDASYRPRLDLREALPRSAGEVLVRRTDGRGSVQVIEQPSVANNFTTTIRVTDPGSGADNYGFLASWRPTGSSGNGGYGNGDYDRTRDRDDDRYGDRNRRDDDRYDDRNNRGRNDDRYDNRGRYGNCDHPNRSNGRGRDDDRCNDRNGNNGRGNDRYDRNDRNGGYDNGMLRWSGSVDDVTDIIISGRRVQYRTRSGASVRDVRDDFRGSLPNREVNVSINAQQGRGTVYVVQQPNRSNNYTAIIRVSDQRSGYGAYDFNVVW